MSEPYLNFIFIVQTWFRQKKKSSDKVQRVNFARDQSSTLIQSCLKIAVRLSVRRDTGTSCRVLMNVTKKRSMRIIFFIFAIKNSRRSKINS
jgi:hypothetical protein